MNVSRKSQATHKEEAAKRVANVVYIKAVTWALLMPKASEGAV
jgi:hypothetical protein